MEFIDNNDKKTKIDAILKIVLLGKEDTGKTKFIERLITINDYCKFNKSKVYISTHSGIYLTRKLKFQNKVFKLDIWDTPGRQIFERIARIFYNNCDVILLFYNSFNKQSFERIKEIYKDCIIQNINKKCIYFIIRNKYDLKVKDKEYVSDEKVIEFADKNNIFFIHVSSYEKYETGIDKLIFLILNEFCKYN